MLYLRTLITVPLALYASRILLSALGVVDFGVWSVVGSVAIFFSFFSNALYVSTQRFITVSLSRDSVAEMRRVFSMSVNCHVAICCIILLLSEIVGVWFLNNRLQIPVSSIGAANIVFQCCLISSMLEVLASPLYAVMMAYEKMSYFAFVSVLTIAVRLGAVLAISFVYVDRLSLYALLISSGALIVFILNVIYCRCRFEMCRYVSSWSLRLMRNMISFCGWNMLHMGAKMGVFQGNIILVNIFGGPVASAAIGIANQVSGNVFSFMENVQTAFNPRITRMSVTSGNQDALRMAHLCAKLSVLLLGIVAIPLSLHIERMLSLWLSVVPDGASTLCLLAMLAVGIDAVTAPYFNIVLAKGNIRKYMCWTSMMLVATIPLAFIALASGIEFQYILIAGIFARMLMLAYTVCYFKKDLFIASADINLGKLIQPVAIGVLVWMSAYFFEKIFCSTPVMTLFVTALFTIVVFPGLFYFYVLSARERHILFDIKVYT